MQDNMIEKYPKAPIHLLDAIHEYAENHTPVGDSFLTAVLANNLSEALGRADLASQRGIFDIVAYVRWEIPAECHGSPERVTAWLSRFLHPESISERLRKELKARTPTMSTRQFQKAVEDEAGKGTRGTSYASVYEYVEGKSKTEPPLSFLRPAAKVLGVRLAWLISEDGKRTRGENSTHGSQ